MRSMFIKVCKKYEFEASHQLEGHEGKCKNLHGHSYKLEVEVRSNGVISDRGPSDGMVIDFSELSRIVKSKVIEPMDHAFISKGDEECLDVLKETGSKIYDLGYRSTVENIVFHIWDLLDDEFFNYSVELSRIRLYETSSGYAELDRYRDNDF